MSQSIYQQYFRYALPTVIAMLVSGLYQIADGIVIGQYVGGTGLAAVNISWSVGGVLIGIGLMLGVGTGALTSIYKGERKQDKVVQALLTGMMLIVFFSILSSCFIWFFSDGLLKLQTSDGIVHRYASEYLSIVAFFSPFLLGSIAFPFLIRNDDSPNFATLVMLCGAVCNIFLDYIFVGILSLGLAGAAWATIISQGVVCLISLSYFFSRRSSLFLSKKYAAISIEDIKVDIKPIIMIGLSSFFMYLYWGVMVALHNHQFSVYGGTSTLGAYATLGYIITFYYLVAEGFANGMQPLASYNFGAQQLAKIKSLLCLTVTLVVAIGGILFVLLYMIPVPIISLFSGEDQRVKLEALAGIPLHLFAIYMDGFLVVVAAFYQSINQGKKAVMITVGNMAIQLPFLFILPRYLGLSGVWIAYPLSNVSISAVVLYFIIRDVKKL